VLDLGTNGPASVDYPDFAEAVGRAVQDGRAWRGVVVCGSGAGACIAANKLRGIRAALAHDTYSAHQSVEHDDANVLCLGARIIGGALAEEIVLAWAKAEFTGEERHQRRLDKVMALETEELEGANR
jgi:ribose 5-phosphate isomerase B